MNVVFHNQNRGMAIFYSNFQIDDIETAVDCKVLVEFNYAYMGGVDEVEVTNIVATKDNNTILNDFIPHLQWMSEMFEIQIRKSIKAKREQETIDYEIENHLEHQEYDYAL